MRLASILLLSAALPALQAQQIPRPAMDYTITLVSGKPTSVSSYKGKVIAVEFLLTTCPHCQQTAKVLTAMTKEFGAKGFQALGAAINEKPDIDQFIVDMKVNYPVGTGPREGVYTFLQHSVMSPNLNMPQLVFIDKAGMVRAQYAGTDDFFKDEEKNIRSLLVKLLAEPATKSTSGTKAVAPAKKAS